MKMNKKIFFVLVVGIGIIIVLIACRMKFKVEEVSSEGTLSNEKIEWGLKRNNNNEQPILDEKSREMVDAYNGITIGNKNDKFVYLTFDLGFEAGYTESILNTLKENNVSAAFFITGHYLNSATDIVKRMIDEGHIVGNHTVNHHSMPSQNNESLRNEIMNLHTALYEKTGYEMHFLRPPKGEFSERNLELINSLGYTNVMWSLAYDDWDENKQGREEYGKNKIIENIHNGAVILLHATSKDNMNILDEVIKEIKNMGYEFRSLNTFKK